MARINVVPQGNPCGKQNLGAFSDVCRGEGLWQVVGGDRVGLGSGMITEQGNARPLK
jgi:hypothetical protein